MVRAERLSLTLTLTFTLTLTLTLTLNPHQVRAERLSLLQTTFPPIHWAVLVYDSNPSPNPSPNPDY